MEKYWITKEQLNCFKSKWITECERTKIASTIEETQRLEYAHKTDRKR
jgi:hypothetical protein